MSLFKNGFSYFPERYTVIQFQKCRFTLLGVSADFNAAPVVKKIWYVVVFYKRNTFLQQKRVMSSKVLVLEDFCSPIADRPTTLSGFDQLKLSP